MSMKKWKVLGWWLLLLGPWPIIHEAHDELGRWALEVDMAFHALGGFILGWCFATSWLERKTQWHADTKI